MKERKGMTRLVVRTMKILLFAVLLTAWPCFADWQFQTVDDQSAHGSYCSMTLDNAGNPHIAYRGGLRNLYYARWSGSQWQTSLVDTDLHGGLVKSMDVGVGVDAAGNVHISYYDNGNIYDADGWFVAYKGDLKYAKWNGSSWSIETLVSDNDAGEYNSLALDANGWPHICFYYQNLAGADYWFGKLQHIWWSGSGWQRETIDDPGSSLSANRAGDHCKIVIDNSNNPRVAYGAFTDINNDYDEHLRYAVRNSAGGWTIEKVNSHIGNWETSLALGPDDTPHIAYYDVDHHDLRYARKTSGTWSITTVDDGFNAGLYLSLAVDEENNPSIAYTDGTYNMIYAQLTAGTWNKETIAEGVGSISLVLASTNNPRIAYYTVSNVGSALEYAKAVPSTAPEAPTGLTATPGDGKVTLSWNSVSGVTGYNVYRSTTSGSGFTKINTELATGSTYEDSTVTNGITYYYQVKSVKDSTESSASSEVSASPTGDGIIGDFCGADFGLPDAYVDVWDLMQFADHWHTRAGEGNWDAKFDLTGPDFGDIDGYADVWDLMVFADNWHKGQKP